MDTDAATERETLISFRIHPSDKARIEALAEGAGLSVSAYVRACALTGRRPKPKPRPALLELDAVAMALLSDTARAVNVHALNVNAGRGYTPADILQTLIALQRLVQEDPALGPVFTAARLADASAPECNPPGPVLWRELGRIGNNLGQIARGMDFGEFRQGARSVQAFADQWDRALAFMTAAMVRAKTRRGGRA